MLVCPICHQSFKKIDTHHLKKHNILSNEQYFHEYGEDAPFGYSEELRTKKSGENHPGYGKPRSEETKAKVSKGLQKMWEEGNVSEMQRNAIGERSHLASLGGNHFNKDRTYSEEALIKKNEKTIQTSLLKYGYSSPTSSPLVQEKRTQTCLETYGVEHVMQVPEIVNKRNKTVLEKYGYEFISQVPEIQYRTQQTFIQTSQEKYGTNHPMQDPTICKKVLSSTYRAKDYMFPSGKYVKVQGYEPFVIDWLLSKGLVEEDIEVENIPRFQYKENRYYFPDIFISSQNLIIEVKSSYTYKADLEKNLLKRQAVIDAGYNFNFYIWDNIKKEVEIL